VIDAYIKKSPPKPMGFRKIIDHAPNDSHHHENVGYKADV
jgi:hypothetical protein